jgi:hypothetical protein
LEIDSIDAPRYVNKKTLPDYSHYGYLTTFKGSSVVDKKPVEFPRQRVYENINENIWHYHQQTESLRFGVGATNLLINEQNKFFVLAPGLVIADTCTTLRFLFPTDNPVDSFIISASRCDASVGIDGAQPISENYRAFPVASPFPDIFKFKSDVPVSFRFRLETWYLVNPLVYITDSPTDTSDETEEEDEYPVPEPGDGDGDGDEFPEADPIPSGRDPRDFPEGSGSSDYFPGAMVRISYTRYPYQANCQPLNAPGTIELGATGPGSYSFEYIGSVNGCDGPSTPGGLNLVTPSGARVAIAVLEEQQSQLATVDSVVYYQP